MTIPGRRWGIDWGGERRSRREVFDRWKKSEAYLYEIFTVPKLHICKHGIVMSVRYVSDIFTSNAFPLL